MSIKFYENCTAKYYIVIRLEYGNSLSLYLFKDSLRELPKRVEYSAAAQIPHSLSSRLQLPLRRTWHAPRRLDTPLPPLIRVNAPFARVATAWHQRGAACPTRGAGQTT